MFTRSSQYAGFQNPSQRAPSISVQHSASLTVDHYSILLIDEISEKYVRLLEAHYWSTQVPVRTCGEESPVFPLDRQGCPLSPLPFNYTMRRGLSTFRRLQLGNTCWVADLEFANILILGDHTFASHGKLWPLEINTSKNSSSQPSRCIHTNDGTLERMLYFKYLGSAIHRNNQTKEEVKLRVGCTKRAFLSLRKTLYPQ